MKKMLLLFVFVGIVSQVVASDAQQVSPSVSPQPVVEPAVELTSAATSTSSVPVEPADALTRLSLAADVEDDSDAAVVADAAAAPADEDNGDAEDADTVVDVSTQS